MSATLLNYIEFPVTDMAASKKFYADTFGWEFQDYGPTYAAITNAGVDGGLDADAGERKPSNHGALVVLVSDDLEASFSDVKGSGVKITKEIFSFPGGRRFQFLDPSGNELAVWQIVEE